MIGYLEGTVRGRCVVTRDGVGYVVQCPRALVEGEEVSLVVETIVRPERIALYGFASELERAAFAGLVALAGVGPAVALAVLGELGAAGLARALRTQDVTALRRARGVAEKGARAILAGFDTRILDGVEEAPGADDARGRLIEALEALGVAGAGEWADRAVASVVEGDEGARVAWVLRERVRDSR